MTDVLNRLRRALEVSKASARTRAQNRYSRQLRLSERKLLPFINRFISLMVKTLKRGLPAAAQTRKASTFVKVLTTTKEWKELEQEGIRIFKKPLLNILEVGGEMVAGRSIAKQAEGFDPMTTAAMSWAEDHTAELVTLITDETVDAIKAFVKDALDRGESMQRVARELRSLVGLTEPHMLAVSNRMAELIDEGLPTTRIESLVERYSNKLHRYRANMIARTESGFALEEGVVEGYDQMGVKKLRWIADEDACDYCKEQDGNVYSIDEAHGLHPAHPQCECTWVAA